MSKESGTRSGLLWEVERLLKNCKTLPQFLLMENVPQVHGKKNIKDFASWISFLESLGYISKWRDLNAKNYGVAQNRERCFMVSYLDTTKRFYFPDPITLNFTLKDYLDKKVDDKYYLSEKMIKCLINHKERNEKKGNSFGVKFLKENDICHSILTSPTKSAGAILEEGPDKIRFLTPLECLRLMGVSDNDACKMLAVNSDTQCYKQAGNSIVVNVMAEIFKNLFLGGSEQIGGQMDIYDIL